MSVLKKFDGADYQWIVTIVVINILICNLRF